MVPAILMGLNIYAFRKKLLTFLYSNQNSLIESVVKLSKIYNSKKLNSLIFLNYAPELNDFLYWCQQLIAESLVKKAKAYCL
jgi:glucose-6-phosphate isomerase